MISQPILSTRWFTRWSLALLALLVTLSTALTRIAAAQGLTGTLIGSVKDEQGAVLPGALVRVASSTLIGGPASVTTNERGQLRFPILPPGTYELDVALSGFALYHEADIRIGAGATIERTVVLRVGGIAESVVVQGTGSRIEARSSGVESRFGAEYLRAVPTRRFSMFDSIRAAPGVSPTSPSSGTVNTVSAFGSGGNENLFLIDGTNFTCPCAGVSRAEPSVDIIQEVQVQSVGVSAEYGNIQGTVFNVVTRQGSNRFLADGSVYGQSSGLTAQPVVLPVAGGHATSAYERNRDFTTNGGGPVRRDRLWFFAGYQYLRDYDSQPGTDPQFPRTYEQNKIFAKLTWQFRPGLQLMQSYNQEFWVNPQAPTQVTPFDATVRPNASVPTVTFGNLTQALSNGTVWDVRIGRFDYSRRDDPNSGDPTRPNRFDRVTGVSSGNPPQIGGLTLARTTFKATLSHYQQGLFGADHEWKVGTQVEQGRHSQPQVVPSGVRFIDNNGQPFQAVSNSPSNSGGEFITAALFATDAVMLGERVTVNAGVRFDHSRAISPDLHAADANGGETGAIVSGLGTLYEWNVVSPRLGVTAKLTADGRTLLRASYGRFNQGVLTGEISPIHPAVTSITTSEFDPATGGYTRLVSVVDPKVNLALDPHTRTPRTDEYSIGVDRELTPRLAAALAYIHKSGGNFIAWTDVGGQYRAETVTLPGGQNLPVFVLTNSPASRRFLLTNPDEYSLTYNGLVAVVEKRRSNGWQALGSYTFSRTYGLQASSGATAADPQVSTVAPAFPTATFGRDPNNLTNAYGRLPNDRPQMFRAMGAFDLPRTGIAVAASFQYFSGKPWAATTQISLPQGDQRILTEPRGVAPSLVAVAARCPCVESHPAWITDARGAAAGSPQRAQQHRRRKPGDRQFREPELRSADRFRGSASRDGRRAIESGPPVGPAGSARITASWFGDVSGRVCPSCGSSHRERAWRNVESRIQKRCTRTRQAGSRRSKRLDTGRDAVIDISRLTRCFGGTEALSSVTLTFPRGGVYGLVGANGAGKTTLIKHVLGLLKAERGSVRVFGLDPVADPVGVLSRIGYLSEENDLPGWMTVGELMRYSRAFYPKWDEAYAEELRRTFALEPGTKIRTLSKGQKARAGLIAALAHRPALLVLDEPSSGLDPIVRRDILGAIIRTIADEGRTVLFSSHLLDEVEEVADHVTMMERGRILMSASLRDIKGSYSGLSLDEIFITKSTAR